MLVMIVRATCTILIALVIAMVGSKLAAATDSVADFYTGKTITVLVGSSPGGGYDGDARIVARNLGRHIPGAPTIIIQNMPGARGLAAANYLYNLAPKDGTFMGILERVHLIDAYLMPDGVRYDERNFNWIGSIGSEEGIAFAWHTALQKTVDDIRESELIVGGNSNSGILPQIFNRNLGTKFKVIKGYTGSETVLLAVERGEVQGIANYSLSNMLSKHSDWIRDHKINVLFQTGETRDTTLPNVPSALDFALNDEKRQALELWLAPNQVARPFAMPAGVPSGRLAAVRQAFMALFQDPVFLSDASRAGMVIEPKDGEFIQEMVNRLRAYPPEIIQAARSAGSN
jgi:tripartite-type tricarboxylate transporter receptor subunit TctC